MFRFPTKLPEKFYLAVSGGIDSMVALSFLSNHKGFAGIVHCHHGTKHADDALEFVRSEFNDSQRLIIHHLREGKPDNKSQEQHWSDWRRKCFNSACVPVLTAHHLGDAVEWWVMSSLHGVGKLMPVESGNVLRPFLTVSKSQIEDWAERKMVKYIDDPSNQSRQHMRNIVRHDMMPLIQQINPGIEKVIRKKYFDFQEL